MHDARLDCDGDTVLLVVDQVGAACHTGNHSCFDTASLPFAVDDDHDHDHDEAVDGAGAASS